MKAELSEANRPGRRNFIGGSDARIIIGDFMLPWSFLEEAAVQKYMPQLQHNMWVVAARSAVLSVLPAANGSRSPHMPIASTSGS
jgi:hypothetical protein